MEKNRKIPGGLFIVLEGVDGSGKSTQARLLCEFLMSEGYDIVATREPTDGPHGRRIREIAARGRAGTPLEEEISLFVDDRREHVREVIRPALKRGAVVVCDRYYFSTMAYQGALGADVDALRRLNEVTNRFPLPDRVYYVRVSPRTGIGRINATRGGANTGYERGAFLKRVAAIFDAMEYPFFLRVRGAGRPETVARVIRDDARHLIGNKTRGKNCSD